MRRHLARALRRLATKIDGPITITLNFPGTSKELTEAVMRATKR